MTAISRPNAAAISHNPPAQLLNRNGRSRPSRTPAAWLATPAARSTRPSIVSALCSGKPKCGGPADESAGSPFVLTGPGSCWTQRPARKVGSRCVTPLLPALRPRQEQGREGEANQPDCDGQ